MQIIQITDQHVGQPGETPNGVDVREQFVRLCEVISTIAPDYVVVTGDLCAISGEAAIYRWMKDKLDGLNIPYAVISGNHDDPALLAQSFRLEDDLHDGELYYRRKIGEEWGLFLDTTPGMLSQKQLQWVREELMRPGPSRQLVFMHHPPILAGLPHMDNNYPLLKPAREALQALFVECGKELFVFCGHYHNEITTHCSYGTIFITPSSYLQIAPYQKEFAIEHTMPGFRYIELQPQLIRSAVHYLPTSS